MVMILFKQKIKPEEHQVIGLLKFFNIPVPKGHGTLLDHAELKKPDFLYSINIKMMQKLFKVMNNENKNVKPELGSNYYRFYVGSGNNHSSVK